MQIIGNEVRRPIGKVAKDDANDAEGLCKPVRRPHMRFIPEKTIAADLHAMASPAPQPDAEHFMQRIPLCNEPNQNCYAIGEITRLMVPRVTSSSKTASMLMTKTTSHLRSVLDDTGGVILNEHLTLECSRRI
jgi:hypothetical protein